MANEGNVPPSKADGSADHPDGCPCRECQDQRDLLDHGLDEPGASEDFVWACGPEDVDPDDTFVKPSDISPFLASEETVPESDPVAYRDKGLLNAVFPPLLIGDWPVPYVKRPACKPFKHEDVELYAFECYEEHQLTHPAIVGLAIFRHGKLVAFGIDEREGPIYRANVDDRRVTLAQCATDLSSADWQYCDTNGQIMLGLLSERLNSDSGILFKDGDIQDLKKARRYGLL